MAIGIHPDDVELGCGGTVALCARRGYEVVIVDLTRGESASNGTPEERAAEASEAARILGARRYTLDLPDAAVRAEDPEQTRAVVRALRERRPEVVLAPNDDDPHPDHASGGRLVQRALYLAGVHGYASGEGAAGAWRVPRVLVYSGRREVRPDLVVDTSDTFDLKLKAIAAHRTQFAAEGGRRPTRLNAPGFLAVVEARDRIHGFAVGARHGEGFALLSPILLDGFEVFGEGP
ncbi:MAG: bacillithiol biosynthesis deacetylase BshB1 [Candidatus Krumholzibacteria bacterium]|nr:bacillithiol biosynthesis deacetylase BshB1 [Candidatus Krumholzibacteria bacterium]